MELLIYFCLINSFLWTKNLRASSAANLWREKYIITVPERVLPNAASAAAEPALDNVRGLEDGWYQNDDFIYCSQLASPATTSVHLTETFSVVRRTSVSPPAAHTRQCTRNADFLTGWWLCASLGTAKELWSLGGTLTKCNQYLIFSLWSCWCRNVERNIKQLACRCLLRASHSPVPLVWLGARGRRWSVSVRLFASRVFYGCRFFLPTKRMNRNLIYYHTEYCFVMYTQLVIFRQRLPVGTLWEEGQPKIVQWYCKASVTPLTLERNSASLSLLPVSPDVSRVLWLSGWN